MTLRVMSWTPLLLSEDKGDGVKVIIGDGDLLLDVVDRDNDGERAKRRLTALVSCDGEVAVSDWAERVMSGGGGSSQVVNRGRRERCRR